MSLITGGKQKPNKSFPIIVTITNSVYDISSKTHIWSVIRIAKRKLKDRIKPEWTKKCEQSRANLQRLLNFSSIQNPFQAKMLKATKFHSNIFIY